MNVRDYWEGRYRAGGFSGAGSRGAEAWAKIALVSRVISDHGVTSLLDLGCGDGFVGSRFPVPRYRGVDVSETAIATAAALRPGGEFSTEPPRPDERFDLTVSMDVIFHLVSDTVFRSYMSSLFRFSPLVLVYGTNKHLRGRSHVLHREWLSGVPDGWDVEEMPVDFKRAWLIKKRGEG